MSASSSTIRMTAIGCTSHRRVTRSLRRGVADVTNGASSRSGADRLRILPPGNGPVHEGWDVPPSMAGVELAGVEDGAHHLSLARVIEARERLRGTHPGERVDLAVRLELGRALGGHVPEEDDLVP